MKTKKKDTFVLAYEKFCPSPKTEELQQNIQSSEVRIELELQTRDLVDQKLLANNAKQGQTKESMSASQTDLSIKHEKLSHAKT